MNWLYEVIGYTGMLFIVSSFFFKNIKRLRIFNNIGSLFCLTYGILTTTYATVALNAVCFIINVIQLIKIYKEKNRK